MYTDGVIGGFSGFATQHRKQLAMILFEQVRGPAQYLRTFMGFCGPGESPDFVANQRTAPGGDFSLNTSGGGLSYTHPGMYGSFLLVEAVRQLRGEAGDRQVKSKRDPNQNAKISIVNGTGGSLSSTGTVVLATD